MLQRLLLLLFLLSGYNGGDDCATVQLVSIIIVASGSVHNDTATNLLQLLRCRI